MNRLKKLQNMVIYDKLTSLLVIHKKLPQFNGCAINVLLTNQSQKYPKGVTMSEGPSYTLVSTRNRTVGPADVG